MDSLHETLVSLITTYGYGLLFLLVSLEGIGLPIPGETAVLTSGFLAGSAGGSQLSLPWVVGITFAAAVTGDNLGYAIGHGIARPRLQKSNGFLLMTPQRLNAVEGYFQRYGIWVVFVARFVSGLRVICSLAAGAVEMPREKFIPANAAGCLTWSIAVTLAGFYLGESWRALHHTLAWTLWATIALAVIALLLRQTFLRRPKNNT